MNKKCIDRQEKILKYLKEIYTKKGYAPTVREICAALGIKSTSTVHSDIKMLESKGRVRRDPSKQRAVIPCDVMPQREIVFETRNCNMQDTVELPLVGRVAAGTPILAEENVEDYISFPARFIGKGNNFLLTVHGNSMINAGINDGDWVIVNQTKTIKNGDIVVAMVEGDFEAESTVKRFYREKGHIRLQPENDEMAPIIVDNCTIIGKVRGVFRYFN